MQLYSYKIGQGQPLVLFHGWGFDHKIMLPLAEALTPFYEVTLLDLPGFGNSPSPTETYSFEQLLTQISAVIPEQALLVGWSLGGLIALKLAEKAKAISLLASSPCFISGPNWPGISPAYFKSFTASMTENPQKTLRKFQQLQGAARIDKNIPPPLQLEAWLQWLDILALTDLRSLPIKPSLQVILGAKDLLLPATLADSLTTLWPNAKVQLVPKQGHLLFYETPKIMAMLLHQFFKAPHAS